MELVMDNCYTHIAIFRAAIASKAFRTSLVPKMRIESQQTLTYLNLKAHCRRTQLNGGTRYAPKDRIAL